MSDTQDDAELAASQFDDAKRSIDSTERTPLPGEEPGSVDDRPALDVEPGDAGPVQEDDDLPLPDEHQGENDDDE
jgi:hypothetical protein